MNKRTFSAALAISLILISTIGFASSGIEPGSGTTDGGTMGKTTCYAELEWNNSSAGGADYAKAKTWADSSGIKTAVATIYYTGPTGNKSNVTTASATGTQSATTSRAYAKSTGHGYKAASGHVYRSDEYGSWSIHRSKSF